MSHRASALTIRAIGAIIVTLFVAPTIMAVEPMVKKPPPPKAEVVIIIERGVDGHDKVDVRPRAVVVCDVPKTDCSNLIMWSLDTALKSGEEIELRYKPRVAEPYLPDVFTDRDDDGLRFNSDRSNVERTVRPSDDWELELGDPRISVWRYDVVLTRDGEVLDRFDPRVIIDRTR
jgi:hypothetical protein